MSGYVIWTKEYGYYDGKILHDDGVSYLAYNMFKDSESVKVYKSEERAITVAEKIKKQCQYVDDYTILPR